MRRKITKFEKIWSYLSLGLAIFAFGLLTYWIFTLIVNGRFSLERTAESLIKDSDSEKYCGSDIVAESKGVAFICYGCTDQFVRKCAGRYALFFERTEEGWIPTEKKVIW